jgi:hypothetical protein
MITIPFVDKDDQPAGKSVIWIGARKPVDTEVVYLADYGAVGGGNMREISGSEGRYGEEDEEPDRTLFEIVPMAFNEMFAGAEYKKPLTRAEKVKAWGSVALASVLLVVGLSAGGGAISKRIREGSEAALREKLYSYSVMFPEADFSNPRLVKGSSRGEWGTKSEIAEILGLDAVSEGLFPDKKNGKAVISGEEIFYALNPGGAPAKYENGDPYYYVPGVKETTDPIDLVE